MWTRPSISALYRPWKLRVGGDQNLLVRVQLPRVRVWEIWISMLFHRSTTSNKATPNIQSGSAFAILTMALQAGVKPARIIMCYQRCRPHEHLRVFKTAVVFPWLKNFYTGLTSSHHTQQNLQKRFHHPASHSNWLISGKMLFLVLALGAMWLLFSVLQRLLKLKVYTDHFSWRADI